MGDMDYNPNPTFNNVEAAPENNNDDNDNVDDKRRALPLRIPQSRGSDSPSVQTPMVSFKYLLHNFLKLKFVQLISSCYALHRQS